MGHYKSSEDGEDVWFLTEGDFDACETCMGRGIPNDEAIYRKRAPFLSSLQARVPASRTQTVPQGRGRGRGRKRVDDVENESAPGQKRFEDTSQATSSNPGMRPPSSFTSDCDKTVRTNHIKSQGQSAFSDSGTGPANHVSSAHSYLEAEKTEFMSRWLQGEEKLFKEPPPPPKPMDKKSVVSLLDKPISLAPSARKKRQNQLALNGFDPQVLSSASDSDKKNTAKERKNRTTKPNSCTSSSQYSQPTPPSSKFHSSPSSQENEKDRKEVFTNNKEPLANNKELLTNNKKLLDQEVLTNNKEHLTNNKEVLTNHKDILSNKREVLSSRENTDSANIKKSEEQDKNNSEPRQKEFNLNPPGFRVKVSGMPGSMDDTDIRDFFSSYGEVTGMKRVADHVLVSYKDEDARDWCVDCLNEQSDVFENFFEDEPVQKLNIVKAD